MLLLGLAGCERKDPGDSIGVFSVTGTLVENTCGHEAVPAMDPLSFEVELRYSEEGLGYWILPGSPMMQGPASDPSKMTFDSESIVNVFGASNVVEETPIYGIPELSIESQTTKAGCDLRQVEHIVVTLSDSDETTTDGAPDGGLRALKQFTGKNTIGFRPTAESDCTPIKAENGGPFLAFPCAVDYELTANEKDPAND